MMKKKLYRRKKAEDELTERQCMKLPAQRDPGGIKILIFAVCAFLIGVKRWQAFLLKLPY
jgi:hypothetical protein